MNQEKLVYEVSGKSKKMNSFKQIFSVFGIGIGGLCIWLSQMKEAKYLTGGDIEFSNGVGIARYGFAKGYVYPEEVRTILIILGGMVIVLCGLLFISSLFKTEGAKDYLKVYEDHVEGQLLNGKQKISLNYNQINECTITSGKLINALLIHSHSGTHIINIEDKTLCNKVYDFINSNL